MHNPDFWVQKLQIPPKTRERGGCVLAADTALTHLVRTLLLLLCPELPVRRERIIPAGVAQGQPFLPSALDHPLGPGTGADGSKPEPRWLKSTGKAVRMCCRVRHCCHLGSRHVPFPSLTAVTCSFPDTHPRKVPIPSLTRNPRAPKDPLFDGQVGKGMDVPRIWAGTKTSHDSRIHFIFNMCQQQCPPAAAAQRNCSPHCRE